MINTLKNSKFVKNVLVVMTGTALAQIITFALMPIVTRIYGPEPIGVLGTFTAVTSILSPLVALTYPIAVVLPKSDKKARSVVKLALSITTLNGLFFIAIMFLFNEMIIELFNLHTISSYVYLIPIFLFLTGLLQVMEQWIIRTKHFALKAKTAVLQSLFINGSKIGVGLFYPLSASLIIIQTAGLLFRTSLMFFMSDKTVLNRTEKHTIVDLKSAALEHRDFPKYRAPQAFINAMSQGLPVLMFAIFFGSAIAGFYSLGRQALNVPVSLVGKAVQDVFYPKVNEFSNDKRSITPIVWKAVAGLFALGIIPFGFIIIFGPWVFSFIFGQEWYTAGEYARWIAFVSLAMLMTRPIIATIPVINIQRTFLFVEIVGTIGKVLALVLGIYLFEEPIYAVASFSIASVMMYVYLTIHTLWKAKQFDKENKREAV